MIEAELSFSVIVPAFNRPDGLRACLDALTRQSFPAHRFEVIVVDDGSSPPLEEVVNQFCEHLQTTYIRVPNGGPATARNHGAHAAKGRYLAFTDHDCVPDPEWLSALHGGFTAHPESMLGGPKHNGLPGNIYSSAHQIGSRYVERWFEGATDGSRYFTTNNFAVPRETFLRIGGFNERFPFAHEDREFGARWGDHGWLVAWIPGAAVVHRHELTLWSSFRQHFRYGSGAIDFRLERRRTQGRSGVRFAGLRFHCGLVAAPFTDGERRALRLSMLLLLSQAAYVAGALTRAVSHRGVRVSDA